MKHINHAICLLSLIAICIAGCDAKTTIKHNAPNNNVSDMDNTSRDQPQDTPTPDQGNNQERDQGSTDQNNTMPDLGQPDGPAPQPPITCPTTQGGPMVAAAGGYYCIDTTEVSRGQYQAWIDTSPSTNNQSAECAWNTDFTPKCSWPPGNNKDLPVSCVDWCDAKAYCEGVGKRLCGRISGGAAPLEAYNNARLSEWFAACSSGGKHAYAAGDTLSDATCRGEDGKTWGTAKIGTHDKCQSPVEAYKGVFDLSGNAMEWVNACDGYGGADDRCRLRGGSYNTPVQELRCDAGKYMLFSRASTAHGVSFRCCAGE